MKSHALIPALTLSATLLSPAPRARAAMISGWNMNEISGSEAYDLKQRNDLSLNGATRLKTGAFPVVFPYNEGSYVLTGTNSLRGTSSSALVGTQGNQISVSFWMKANAENEGGSIFYISNVINAAGLPFVDIQIESSTGVSTFDIASFASNGGAHLSGDLGVVSDKLHQYVLTFDGNTGRIAVYKDTALSFEGLGPVFDTLPWTEARSLEIGRVPGGAYWPGGQVDDVGLFNSVLTDSERQRLYTQGVTAFPEPGGAALMLAALGTLTLRRGRTHGKR